MIRILKNIIDISLILFLVVVLFLVVRNIYYTSNIQDVTNIYIEDKGQIRSDIALNDIIDENTLEPIIIEDIELSTEPVYNMGSIIIIIILALLTSVLVIYLILSKFNLLNIREIFKTKRKILVSIIGILLLTSIISLESIFIPRIYYNNSNYYITIK